MYEKKAAEYLKHTQDLAAKLNIQLKARMEFVLRFDTDQVPTLLDPNTIFDVEELKKLLRDNPMVLPFQDKPDGNGLYTVNKMVLNYLITILENAVQSQMNRGGFENTWRAYQAELALEEFFHGTPQSQNSRDREYSGLLGTCSLNPESKTYKRGALALGYYGAAAANEDSPEIIIWSPSREVKKRIERLFRISDYMQAEPTVIGREMVLVLIDDLYCPHDLNRERTMQALQSDEFPRGCMIVEYKSIQEYALELVKHSQHFKYPKVFRRMIELVEEGRRGERASSLLEAGFRALGLKRFPRVSFNEAKDFGKKMSWYKIHCLVKFLTEEELEAMPAAAVRQKKMYDILAYLKANLAFQDSSIEPYRIHGLPWYDEVERRIPAKRSLKDRAMVHAFCTMIGHLQRGQFVNFGSMGKFMKDMCPVRVSQMQKWKLLSHEQLRSATSNQVISFHQEEMFKLDESIPTFVPEASAKPREEDRAALPVPQGPEPSPVEERMEDNEQAEEPVYSRSRRMPANSSTKWAQVELQMIPGGNLTTEQAWQQYRKNCDANNTAIRSREAFRKKRAAVMKSPQF